MTDPLPPTTPPSRALRFPWAALALGALAIVVVVVGLWEVVLRFLFPQADRQDLSVLYLVRGLVLALGLLSYSVYLVVRQLRLIEGRLALAEASERRFRALIEAAPDSIVLSDAKGRIVLVNSQAERAFAYGREELVGKPVELLVAEPHRPDFAGHRGRDAAAQGTPPATLSLRAVRRDGSEFPAEVSLSPLEWEEGLLMMTVLRDVTERLRAEEERAKAWERLQELERLKEIDKFRTQLINTAAHELRTPLTPIQLQVDLLQLAATGPLTERQHKALSILSRNVERLSKLLEDVLQVARLQAGRLAVNRQPTDLARVILEAVETYQEPARRGGLTLESRLAPGLMAEADPARITQVLFNFLSNAVKFTPPGGRITVEAAPTPTGILEVRVRDTGSGLKPEDLERLFQPFTQVHNTSERTDPGAGLGLYISRGIVELHGGRIWAESEGPGKGSTFAFSIPAGLRMEPPTPAREDAFSKRARELV